MIRIQSLRPGIRLFGRFDDGREGWKIEPADDGRTSRLVPRPTDEIICADYPAIPEAADDDGGHGSGAVSWAPIMGTGYYTELTQWSRGEYSNANRPH